MKANTPGLMKFQRLQRRLKESKRGVIGLLEGLWIAAAQNCPHGDIGKFSNEEIAIMVDWEHDPDELVKALIDSRWIDECEKNRLVLHDWFDHCPTYIKGVVARERKRSPAVKEPEQKGNAEETPFVPLLDDDNSVADFSIATPNPQRGTVVAPSELPTTHPIPSGTIRTNNESTQLPFLESCSDDFRKVWGQWKMHLLDITKKMSTIQEEQVLIKLSTAFPGNEAEQIKAINYSIESGAKNLILNGDHRQASTKSGKLSNFAGSKPSRRIPTFKDIGLVHINDGATS